MTIQFDGMKTDAYTSTMCYYLRCPGFVQTSRTVLIEGAISPASTIGGLQTELTIQVWKDPARGPWWLGVGFSNGTKLSAIGYWPVEIFSRLADHAENKYTELKRMILKAPKTLGLDNLRTSAIPDATTA
ncbi:PREDICTED: uncharacterized protein LOC106330357 [Brassica oleracea var. oleracea]|uniref:uncharacterized protein LOC106330357 n=1 Tax=Brassica oleracea var. oleracea TaxID=109376 RepID=UPI0006A6B5FE|nr:PREDICTED: uncharacterized protein LOC106330357 [Brassica oleracea var. oleracea]